MGYLTNFSKFATYRKGNGAENRIRTDDLRITNALLYQLSYLGIP